MLLSLLLILAPLSASACDLSCWLQKNAPDCHWLGSTTENAHEAMAGASEMNMASGADVGLADKQSDGVPDQGVIVTAHHSMAAQMNMRRVPIQVIQKSDASSSATFDDSNTVSPCVHGTCAQAATPTSPPKAGHAQLVHLPFVPGRALNLDKPLTISLQAAPETSPPASVRSDFLPTLRI